MSCAELLHSTKVAWHKHEGYAIDARIVKRWFLGEIRKCRHFVVCWIAESDKD